MHYLGWPTELWQWEQKADEDLPVCIVFCYIGVKVKGDDIVIWVDRNYTQMVKWMGEIKAKDMISSMKLQNRL